MVQNAGKPRTVGAYFPNIPRVSVYIYMNALDANFPTLTKI